jgi:hypothetical protein
MTSKGDRAEGVGVTMKTKAGRKSGERERARLQPLRNAKAKSAGATAEGPGGRLKPSEQIDQHIAGISDWRGKVLATIRRIVREADPAVTEDWKWMGTPVWYCDGMVSLANPHRGKVKWTFVKGAHFADADRLFNAGLEGNDWRAIDIFEKDRLDEAALRRLVRTAVAYNRSQTKGKQNNKVVEAGGKKLRRVHKKA